MERVDVLIAGGGPAGVATALALRQLGLSVSVVEPSGFQDVRVGEHLDPAALPLLRSLGIEPALWHEQSLTCAGVASYWGAADAAFSSAVFNPYGAGLILSRPGFDRRFAQAAQERGVLWRQARVVAVRQEQDWQVRLRHTGQADETTCTARFLVDASGRGAHLARLLGAKILAWDRLSGLAAYLPEPMPGTSLHIEANANGWWYTAPLFDGRRIATFMTDADLLSANPAQYWRENFLASPALCAAFAHLLPARPDVIVRPARSQRLNRISGPGWLATGDAAISYDPLSSAGIRKGLELGALAAQAIGQHLQGQAHAVDGYANEVRARFEKYLRQRASYYRMEQRWPNSVFWQRRHAPLASEIPVWLDPALPAAGIAKASSETVAHAAACCPALDIGLLQRLAHSCESMGEVAQHYQARVACPFLDRDIIIGMQYLTGMHASSQVGPFFTKA